MGIGILIGQLQTLTCAWGLHLNSLSRRHTPDSPLPTPASQHPPRAESKATLLGRDRRVGGQEPTHRGWEAMGDGPQRRWVFKPQSLSLVVPLGFIYKASIKDITNKNFKTASEGIKPQVCVVFRIWGPVWLTTLCACPWSKPWQLWLRLIGKKFWTFFFYQVLPVYLVKPVFVISTSKSLSMSQLQTGEI